MDDDVNALRGEIAAAFDWRRPPAAAAGGDDAAPCPGDEGEEVARFFRGKDWREVTVESILEAGVLDANSFLFFMDAESFVYFLPAVLELSLPLDERFDASEALAFKLTPPPPAGAEPGLEAWRRQFAEITSSLTPAETRAVAHALEYLAREFDRRGYTTNQARVALDTYWARRMEDLSS